MNAPWLRFTARALGAALLCALAGVAQGGESYVGRPVYSEPGAGLQLPPGCHMEPTWRARMGASDMEVWVVDCGGIARSWFVRRSLIEMVKGNQARLRFQVLDERQWPGETAGDTVSVQCVGKSGADDGYVVLGAKWRAAGNELRLIGAQSVIRADPNSQKFVAASLAQVECTRHPDREAMLRRLQQTPR